MTLLSPPSVSHDGPQPPDDVDRILRAFFKAQMPDPWPSAEAPPPRRVAPPPAERPAKQWPLMRSRLALAASVALLVTGFGFLAGAFQGRTAVPSSPSITGTTAEHVGPDALPIEPPASKLKVDTNLIQGPNGTTIQVQVIDVPLSPK